MNEYNPEMAYRFISARQGFHQLVLRNRETDPCIVDKNQEITDINVSGIYEPTPFTDMTDVIREYEWLAENLSAQEPDYEIIQNKITADRMMTRVLSGEDVPFDEFYAATVGVELQYFSTGKFISPLCEQLDELLQERGLQYKGDPSVLKKFDEIFILKDEEAISSFFKTGVALSRMAIANYMEPSDETIEPELFSDQRISWSGYFGTTEQGEFFLKANIHPSRRYTAGKILSWMLHEIGGHFEQVQKWKYEIERGNLSPAAGLTAMHSPETTHAETVTAFIQSLLQEVAESEEEKWQAEYQARYDQLSIATYHNAHLMTNDGIDEKTIIRYLEDFLPFESRTQHQAIIRDGRDKATFRAAYGCYGPALELAKPLIEAGPSEKKHQAVKQLYEKSLTVDQIGKTIAAVHQGQST